jgi:2-polyprenyl-6-methoxyphenol hydroxylase-like FAD-dependent oxidoreductase
VLNVGAPIDVLWMRVSRKPSDGGSTLGRLHRGRFMVTIDRRDYWQCAFVIRKGGIDRVKAAGLESLRQDIAIAAPVLADRVKEIRRWDDVKLLTVTVDRLERWSRPGLICIGDAAHAMSPIGGVGINLAIQDAVAAANRLAGPLREGRLGQADLDAIQQRRTYPTKLIQGMQVFVQDQVLSRIIGRDREIRPPLPFRLLDAVPYLRRFPAWFIGVGPRPEHVDPALLPTSERRSA